MPFFIHKILIKLQSLETLNKFYEDSTPVVLKVTPQLFHNYLGDEEFHKQVCIWRAGEWAEWGVCLHITDLGSILGTTQCECPQKSSVPPLHKNKKIGRLCMEWKDTPILTPTHASYEAHSQPRPYKACLHSSDFLSFYGWHRDRLQEPQRFESIKSF